MSFNHVMRKCQQRAFTLFEKTLVTGLVILAACQEPQVAYYEIPKEEPPAPSPPQLRAGHPPNALIPTGISWDLPAGWQETGRDQYREGVFRIVRDGQPALEAFVMAFPPENVEQSNFSELIERQLHAHGSDEHPAPPSETEVIIDGVPSVLLSGKSPSSADGDSTGILAAVVSRVDSVWYFQLKGPAEATARERAGFMEFLESVEFVERRAAQSPAAASGAGMARATLPPGATTQSETPAWTVPDSWSPGRPSSIRKGSFQVIDASGRLADISVTAFPGDVGGFLPNVNRWRRQIGLGPASAEDAAAFTSELTVDDKTFQMVDFSSTSPPAGKLQSQRIVAASVMFRGNTWFFKMTGDKALVESELGRFVDFVRSVRFND